MATRQAIREKIVDRLYRGHEIVRGTTTSAGDSSSVIDTALIQGMFEVTDYIGAYIWLSSGSADEEGSKIISFDRTAGDFTVSPVYSATVGTGVTYEIHYDLHPARVNEAIVWAIEYGSSQALSAPTADASSTTLETEVVVEGALSFCKMAIARQTGARDPATPKSDLQTSLLLKQAKEHEANWLAGLELVGYTPYVGTTRVQ